MVIYFEKISICTPFSTIVNSPRSSASFSQRRFSLSVKMCGVVMLQFCIASLEIYILQLSPELSLPSSIYLAERVPFSGTLICVSTPPGRMVPLKYSPSENLGDSFFRCGDSLHPCNIYIYGHNFHGLNFSFKKNSRHKLCAYAGVPHVILFSVVTIQVTLYNQKSTSVS